MLPVAVAVGQSSTYNNVLYFQLNDSSHVTTHTGLHGGQNLLPSTAVVTDKKSEEAAGSPVLTSRQVGVVDR